MSSINYYISCEGETEIWYFEWLQKQINNNPKSINKVVLHLSKGRTLTDYAKSNAGAFYANASGCNGFYRVQDIEDYSDYHIQKLHELCDNAKKAKSITPNCEFNIAYSNFTFEIWIIAHKAQVGSVIDRTKYFKEINRVFGTGFNDNSDYKIEKNFKKILSSLTLDDVINNALPECARIRTNNTTYNKKQQRQYKGFTYYLTNPDTNIDTLIYDILHNAGII